MAKKEKVKINLEDIIGDSYSISQTERNKPNEQTELTEVSGDAKISKPTERDGKLKLRKSLEEYQSLFLVTPKIANRKTVFISEDLRDRIDEIARKLGDRKMSVSGFIENLVRYHLGTYQEELEKWKRL